MALLAPAAAPRNPLPDPDDRPITCEVCGTVVRVGDSFSFLLSWGTTGPVPITAFGCTGGQHFCCSRDCAVQAAHACIDEHLVPLHEERHHQVSASLAAKGLPLPGSPSPAAIATESAPPSGKLAPPSGV